MLGFRIVPICLLAVAIAAPAAAQTPRVTFHIAAGPLDRVLADYARQSGRQVLVDHLLVADRTSPGLEVVIDRDGALARLLAPEGLVAQATGRDTFIVKRSSGASAGRPARASADADTSTAVETVVVTGTFIRGAPAGSSPVKVFDREQMDRAGQATVADALSALPQNFGGVSTPQTALLGVDGLSTNAGVSTGANLRGLGATSTLVLVNGRRLAGSGLKGDFADVSAIPTAAVDRVEVLLDGASALYGSDAVGGVVNIILRKDFDGAETRLRYSAATQGGAEGGVVGQTFGHVWSSGHALVSYEYQDSGSLAARDRPFTADQELRGLGGTDHRQPYSHPGNILGFDPASGGFVPTYAIPADQDGRGLRPGDFIAGGANLENNRSLSDVLPAQTRHSLYVNLTQDLNAKVEVSLDARYTRRAFAFNYPEPQSVFLVDASNPYYVAPNGAASELIGYAFGDETGPVRNRGVAENFGATAAATVDLGHSWKLDLAASLAQDQEQATSSGLINAGFLNEALGAVPDDPATGFNASRDGYFNPFGGTATNSKTVLDFISSGYAASRTLSRVQTLDAKADGRLLQLPGGDLRMALGVEHRRETFVDSTTVLTSGATPFTDGGKVFARSITAGFAELRVPLFGAPNARPGLRRLELSLAGRVESFSDVGVAGTPKIGVLWSPVQDVRVRATYSQSFRAPGLTEVNALEVVAPAFATRGSDQVLSLVRYGGDPALRPETATSWTAGAEWKPTWLTGLNASLGWFDISYRNRIGQPVLEDFDNALSNPAYASFVTLVDPARSAADTRLVQSLLDHSTSASAGLFPADAYGAVIDARYVNASGLEVSGVDLDATYGFSVGPQRVEVGFNASYLTDYLRRVTDKAPDEELAGRTGYPARLRLRSFASWRLGAYASTLGLNYASGSKSAAAARVDDWTTVDLQLSWTPTRAPLKGLVLSVTAQNLFDTDPPFYNGPTGIGYDPANADALGRVVAIQLSRRW